MTGATFVRKLKALGHTPHNAHELLGISRSAAYKYAADEAEVPTVVQKLLDMYERHGVPEGKKR
jgi:hypothetical protein